MRLLLIAILLSSLAHAADATYPHWDGSDSIAEYAKRANLPPTRTLDLGGGVKLELVLIPAGKFTMGTPEPKPVDDVHFLTQVQVGLIAVWIGGSVLPILLVLVIERAIRQRRRLQWSLAWLLGMVLGTAVVLLGGLHWYYSEQAFAQAQSEYEAAVARFKSSYKCEKPAHGVTLTKPYYIGKYEITQEQYQSIMGNNPSSFKGRDLPVEQVSWNDAQEFCKKVSEKTGSVARLPTEAEWERACRAGTKTTYYTGDSDADLDRAGWYDKNSKKTTHPVGQKTPNAWGVYDMHGNVLEWCADWFEAYKCDSTVDPQCTAQEQGRVSRGGSRIGGPGGCRSANRGGIDPDGCGNILGFRVMVAVPRTPQ